jgi:uncharacterized protein involved in copper resistance
VLHSLKILIVLLLVALVPARAIGSVTLSICASQQEQGAAAHHDHAAHAEAGGHGDHAHGMDHGDAPQGDAGHACGYCAAHCAGVAFAVTAGQATVVPSAGADRIPFGSWSEPIARIFRLDRPPLVS